MVDGPFVAGLASAALLLVCVLLQAPRSGHECSPRDPICLDLVRQLTALERQWAADDELGRVAARVHGAPRDEAVGEGACAATVGDVELSECLAAAASASAAAPGDAAGESTEQRVWDGEEDRDEALAEEALAEEALAEDARANDGHADDAYDDRRGAGGVYNCSWHGPFQGDFSTGLLSKRPVIGVLENVLRTCERNRECAAVVSVPGDLTFRRFLLVRGRVAAQPSVRGAVHYVYRCSPHEVPPLPPLTPAEPEPTIEPWKWPAVRGPSLSGYDVAGHASIFVHIASFRDSKCPETIEDALAKAQHPERLVFGVVDQRLPGEGDAARKCVPAPSECARARAPTAVCRHLEQVRVHEMDARLAKGPTAARHRADLLYHGETFLLQIDAHMIFVRGWDVKAEAQWASLGNDRAVLTGYPTTAVGTVDGVSGAALLRSRPVFCHAAIREHDGVIKWPGAVEVEVGVPPAADHDGPRPIKVPYWAAGLSFSRGHRAIVVPYDCCTPALFMGEELMMAARMLTHGYDLYAFTESLVFHYYPSERLPHDPPFFFNREANDEARAVQVRASWARALALLRLPGAGAPPEAPYDIGTARPVERLLRVWGLGWDEETGGLSPGKDLCDVVLDGRFSFDADEELPNEEDKLAHEHKDELAHEHEDERGHEREGDEREGDERGHEHQHGRIGDVHGHGHGHEREGDERGREHEHGDQDIAHELELDLLRDLDSERVSGHGVTEQGLQPDEATDLQLQSEAVDHEHGFEAGGLALRVTHDAEQSAEHGALVTLDPQAPAASESAAETVTAVSTKSAEAKTGAAVATKDTEAKTGAAVAAEAAEVETGAAVATEAAATETGAAVNTEAAEAETVAAVATETTEAETGMKNAETPANRAAAVTSGAVSDQETKSLVDGTRSDQAAAVIVGAVADQEATLAIESARASSARETHECAADTCAAESPAKLTLASDGPETTSAAAETSDGAPTAGVKAQAPIADSRKESTTQGRIASEGALTDASSSADPAAVDKSAPVGDDAKVAAAAATSAAPTIFHRMPDPPTTNAPTTAAPTTAPITTTPTTAPTTTTPTTTAPTTTAPTTVAPITTAPTTAAPATAADADTGSSRGASSHSRAAGTEVGEEEELDI